MSSPRRPLDLDEETYAQVVAEAEKDDRLITPMLRRLVQEALKERTRRRKPRHSLTTAVDPSITYRSGTP